MVLLSHLHLQDEHLFDVVYRRLFESFLNLVANSNCLIRMRTYDEDTEDDNSN
ncbi:hypothetical protein KSD_71600 [Ktedonobacter sp. SOSP1-85]|nr:hypothetical protein KSD_71600 [Ktedonobacter sp. SOSP1-85]